MTPHEFIDYLAKTHNIKHPQAVLKAVELLKVNNKGLIYRWLNGKTTPHPGKLAHMQKIVECDTLKKRVQELEEKLNQK